MNDPHDRFSAWLTAGASGEPPRDAAIHATGCASCMRQVGALDDLLAIDAGAVAAPLRTLDHPGRPPRSVALRAAQVGAGGLAVVLVGAALTIGIGSLLPRTGDAPPVGALATETPTGEGVLAGGGGPDRTERPEPSPTPTASAAEAEATASPTDVAAPSVPPGPLATPPPVLTPPVVSPRPTIPPQPTATPTQPPTPVSPSPTPLPSAAPTPLPTEIPTPTPTPPPASEEPPAP